MMKRNFGLDVIRAAAIIFVLFNHVLNFFINFPNSTMFGDIGGFLGVELFFVLSGFLIGRILLTQFKHHISKDTIRTFYIRRWFRTLPLYYFLLIIFVIAGIIITKKFDLHLLHFFFLQNLSASALHFFSVSWSLVIEEWFYLLLPLLLLLRYKLGWFKGNTLMFLLSVVIMLGFLRIGYVYTVEPTFEEMRKNMFLRFDSLLIGVLLAGIKLNKESIYKKLQGTTVFFCSLAAMIVVLMWYSWLFKGHALDSTHLGRAMMFPLLSLTIAGILPFFETSTIINSFFARIKPLYWFITWTSIVSYSLYLIHLSVFDIIKYYLFDKVDLIIMMVIALSIAFVIAYLLNRYIESPFMKYRDKFFKQH